MAEKKERKLYAKKCAKPTQTNINTHKQYKKTLDKIKRTERLNKLKKDFSNSHGNSKKTWTLIQQSTTKKTKDELSDQFNIDGTITEDKAKIASHLNTYFNSIGVNLANKTKKANISAESYANKCKTNLIFKFKKVTNKEILDTCKKLKPKSSSGPDGIPSKIIKEIAAEISKPLTHIVNLSLLTGEIPTELKESIIKPIFKDGDKKEASNHRPISLLNAISKLLEKVIHSQLYQHFSINDLLTNKQFGFLNKSSCEHAMISLLSTIEKNKLNGKHTNLTFIDLSKAFDTLNHDILLTKLSLYGINGTELLWFKNYLLNRQHSTFFKGTLSEKLSTNTGVPQGSILGPLLFLIYINDLAENVNGTLLYADDTTLINEDNDLKELEKKANHTVKTAADWFKANKLTLNAKKQET